ncbi:EfeM/EfeO family lipoprotein [Streptomyces echinoruber]|uniref:Iron transporter n=1 Tax=Streptomyces echinoruber TaxID=68898 RepID=A0A918VBX8_9ACTN|nr:EfeM/EfeO family lipoprotein [Streptomyces echinoruber]GGZ88047.1 iron transporter [Streptomyces echinoruber]
MPVPGLGPRPARPRAGGGPPAALAVAAVAVVLAVALIVLAVVLVAAPAGVPGARGGHGRADTAAAPDGLPHTTVEISPGHCGRGWRAPRPGLQVFDLHNTSDRAAEAYLEDPRSHAVHGELEGIAPGTTRQLTVRLGKGAYAFRCVPDDSDAVTGPTVRVTSGVPGPAAAPVTEHDLVPPALAYQKWVGAGLDTLVRLTGALRAAIDRGDLAAARRAWLPAHLQYARLGAAYGAFGDAGERIDGTDAGLPGGVRDPRFTGFHRLEYGLWHGRSAGALRASAAALARDVGALRDGWAQARVEPGQLGVRAHEILEDTVQFELTGRTDYGSGSSLATARAHLDGTRAVLSRLRPLLATRYPQLPRLEQEMDRARRTLDALGAAGRPTPLARLTRRQREAVDAVFGDLVERLAPVAVLCDPRRTT